MFRPRWRKVIKDLWGNKTRSVLAILTIAVGVFAVGLVTTAFIIALGDMDAAYQAVNPHSGTLFTNNFDEEMLHKWSKVPGVKEVDGRASMSGRALLGPGTRYPINIQLIPPVGELMIDKVVPHPAGTELVQPGEQEVLIERSVLGTVPLEVGDSIEVELSDGKLRTVRIAGFVNDMQAAPFTFGRMVYAYTGRDGMEWLGGPAEFSNLLFTTTEKPRDEAHVTEVGARLKKEIERGGTVYFIYTSKPGRHWAADITGGMGFLMAALGALAVFLSTFLVINSISNILSQHVRQIGIMKSVGGRSGQIGWMYLALVVMFGLLAFAVSAPLAANTGYQLAAGFAQFLNFDLKPNRVLPEAMGIQLAIALIVPVLAALVPVWRGTRITVREAISSYGLGAGAFGKGLIDRILERIHFLSRPLMISLRNTFRRKGRLLLTLTTLTLAGAIFISVINMRTSFDVLIPKILGYFLSDVNVSLERPYRLQKLEPIVMEVPGVERVEGWAMENADVLTGENDAEALQVVLIAPPNGSTLIQPDVTSGRWLEPGDQNAIVVGNHYLARRPETRVGDTIAIKIGEKEVDFKVVGTYMLAGNVNPPLLYVNYDYLTRVTHRIGTAFQLRIVTEGHDKASQGRVVAALEGLFRAQGINTTSIMTGAEISDQQMQSINIFVILLLVMSLLIALVGGIGLMGTMSMNVMERTREIGVMRAIGARNGTILKMVITEGMLIGTISWILGSLLAYPITQVMVVGVGQSLVQAPMPFVYGVDGLLMWLAAVLIISALASFMPAWSAMRLTIREVLAYE